MMFADHIEICSESREQVEENEQLLKDSHSKTEYMRGNQVEQ